MHFQVAAQPLGEGPRPGKALSNMLGLPGKRHWAMGAAGELVQRHPEARRAQDRRSWARGRLCRDQGSRLSPVAFQAPVVIMLEGRCTPGIKAVEEKRRLRTTPVSRRWEENVAETGKNCSMAPGSWEAAQLPNVYADAGPGACPPGPSSEQAPEHRRLWACRGRGSPCRRSCSRRLSWCRHVFALLV